MVRATQRGRVVSLAMGALVLMLPALHSAPLPTALPVGPVTQAQVRALARTWHGPTPELKGEPMRMLAQVSGKAQVKVFFGAWCEDSQREVPRFLKIVADLGAPPFAVEFIAVDKEKKQPARLLEDNDVRFLPTFVIFRQGREVGRIVGRPPRGLEADLALLLTGGATGLISGSDDVIWDYLAPSAPATNASPGVAPARLAGGQAKTRAMNASAVDKPPQRQPPPR